MSTTETAGRIFELIPLVMQDIGAVSKDRKNEQQRYSFRGIEDFYQAAHPALIKHGVFCAPRVIKREEYRFDKTNDQGRTTSWLHVALEVEHRFYAGDGSYVSVVTWGEGLDNSDKATNKAMSGAMKYALIELFTVPTQDVEDADRSTPELGTRRNGKPVERTTEDIHIEPPKKVNAAFVANVIAGKQDAERFVADGIATGKPPSLNVDKKQLRDLQAEAKASLTAKPATLPEGAIEPGQAKNFAIEFEKALKPELRKRASDIEHAWLKKQGIVDGDGAGTAKAILKANFYTVREEAISYATKLESWG